MEISQDKPPTPPELLEPKWVQKPPKTPYIEIKKFVLELMPRGSLKSTIGTEGFPLYCWLFNPNLRIHIASETLAKSELYAGAIKNNLESNMRYREVFQTIYGVVPDAKRDRWTSSELNLAAKTSLTREPNLSIGSPDVPKVGQHFDIIIIDDLMGPTNITDTGIEKAINYYKGLLSVLEPDGIMIVIGTRWHFRDVYGYIIQNEDRFQVLKKSAWNDDGSLFYPERLSEDFLQRQQSSQGSYFFSAQYKNEIVDESSAPFKRDNFRYEEVDVDSMVNPLNVFMTIDPVPPGSEEKNDPDYFAICIAGMDRMGKIYYLGGWKGRPNENEAANKIIELHDIWKPKKVGFENIGFQKVYRYILDKEIRRLKRNIYIEPIKRSNTRASKNQRITRLVPYVERGDFIFSKKAEGLSALENEMTDFPRGVHDDLLDALTDILDVAYAPRRHESLDENDLERRKKKSHRKYRSLITRA